jgi:transketolase
MQAFIRSVRHDILKLSYVAKASHIPSALSMAHYLSVFISIFWDKKHKVVLGKSYGSQAYYSILSRHQGMQPNYEAYATDDLHWKYGIGREHAWVDFADDTMGSALSIACGMALASEDRVWVNISDASLQMGSIWEAIMFAGSSKLSSILLTVDANDMQILGATSDIVAIEPLREKFESFGWQVFFSPGHDIKAIYDVLHQVYQGKKDAPCVIIFETIKGYGIPFMENNLAWHYQTLSEQDYQQAIEVYA